MDRKEISYEDKLIIAKQAYKDIQAAIDEVESMHGFDICGHWDGCISVNDVFFTERELREDIIFKRHLASDKSQP